MEDEVPLYQLTYAFCCEKFAFASKSVAPTAPTPPISDGLAMVGRSFDHERVHRDDVLPPSFNTLEIPTSVAGAGLVALRIARKQVRDGWGYVHGQFAGAVEGPRRYRGHYTSHDAYAHPSLVATAV
jgi:hypothetical protein